MKYEVRSRLHKIVHNHIYCEQTSVVNLVFKNLNPPTFKEIQDWILVDKWLAEKLERNKQIVVSYSGNRWWGRKHDINFREDPVLKLIAKNLIKEKYKN